MIQLTPQGPTSTFFPALSLSFLKFPGQPFAVLNLTLAADQFIPWLSQNTTQVFTFTPLGFSIWASGSHSWPASDLSSWNPPLPHLSVWGHWPHLASLLGYWPTPKNSQNSRINDLGSHCFPVYPDLIGEKIHFPFSSPKEVRISQKRISTEK